MTKFRTIEAAERHDSVSRTSDEPPWADSRQMNSEVLSCYTLSAVLERGMNMNAVYCSFVLVKLNSARDLRELCTTGCTVVVQSVLQPSTEYSMNAALYVRDYGATYIIHRLHLYIQQICRFTLSLILERPWVLGAGCWVLGAGRMQQDRPRNNLIEVDRDMFSGQ